MQPLPTPPTVDCTPMDICSLCRNATGLVRARIAALSEPKIFRWTDKSTVFLTPATLSELSVLRGPPLSPPTQLHIGARVDSDGWSEAGPLKDDAGFMSMYFFINDSTTLPTYTLGCGGHFWPVASDGGEPMVQSTYLPAYFISSGSPGEIISESDFLRRVWLYWGAAECP